ncbi:MAG: hypothetical protein AB7V56_08920 [Candidatus Nitrosocosmicus sp.]
MISEGQLHELIFEAGKKKNELDRLTSQLLKELHDKSLNEYKKTPNGRRIMTDILRARREAKHLLRKIEILKNASSTEFENAKKILLTTT